MSGEAVFLYSMMIALFVMLTVIGIFLVKIVRA